MHSLRRYTEIVAEYISKGYTINPASMSGSQGETTKVEILNLVQGFLQFIKSEHGGVSNHKRHDDSSSPHQLCHTYITNLIYAAVDPKTVQYLAGHENSKITMDIYAKVKYNKPEQHVSVVNSAFS